MFIAQTIEDIPLWTVDRGVSHIVMTRGTAVFQTRTACDLTGNFNVFQEAPTPRICRKCRLAIDEGRLVRIQKG